MVAGLILLSMVAADPAQSAHGAANAQPPLRKFHEINADLRSLFLRERQAKSAAERATVIFEMTELYQEIRRDPRLEQSRTLTSYKNKLWSRLTRIKAEINKYISRSERQRGAAAADVAVPADEDLQTATLAAAGAAGHLDLAGAALGGPASVFAQGSARGGRAIPDYGPALVALIERTIAPEFWDTNGGPGTIVYYQPLMCLVVRATSEVHHLIGGTTGALRAAGR